MTEFYEDVISRANAEWYDLLSRLNPSCSPFTHEFQFAWVCNEDVFDYIYHTHRRDIIVSEDSSLWMTAREIRYRGHPVRIRTYWEDCHNQNPMFAAIVLNGEEAAEYTAHHYLNWFPVGTKVLRGDYLLEVVEAGRHHVLTTIGTALDYQWYITSHFIGRRTEPNDNKTYISSNYEWPGARDASWIRDWDWPTYDLRAEDIRAALAREDARQWTRRGLGKFTHEYRAPELDDDFESPDLSTLFGDVMPKE